MAAAIFIFTLTAFCLVRSQADINITDYIYWKKADINQWHQFFPSRALEEERQTIDAAVAAIDSLNSGLGKDLAQIVAYQTRELETAKQLMAGTDAEGCINGISNFLVQAIQDQKDEYDDCSADGQSKLARLKNSWARLNSTYVAAFQRALAGIDACAKTYPNKDSIDRLRSCVESMNNNYFTAANNTQKSVFPSPSMSYFQSTVVDCASTAANNVASKGSQFLDMLVNCAALSGTVDPATYSAELKQWKGYNDTLAKQILDSQNNNYFQVWAVEKDIVAYYNLQKAALEKYVIESRGQDFYLAKIYSYLNDYYNTVTATSLDNPGDSGCAAAAKSALDNVANAGAVTSLSCDLEIVNNTKTLLAEILNNFLDANNIMPSIGNVAVLNCLSQGYVFAPNTIKDCVELSSADFNIKYTDGYESSAKDISVIAKYIQNFYSNVDLPCDGSSLKRMLLGGDTALYKLQRCLYAASGTTYEVTTPLPFTTTPDASYV